MTPLEINGRTALKAVALAGFCLLGAIVSANAAGPSFDCAKASVPAEETICAEPELARMDLLVAKLFKSFTPEFGDKRAIARALLADRNACGTDVTCLAGIEADMLTTYGDLPEWASRYLTGLIEARAEEVASDVADSDDEAVPDTMGACAPTHINELGTRFSDVLGEDDDGAGSRVGFTNGGGQVSYEHEPALVASRLGDQVVLCLVSVPRDCPAGDDRGRGYFTLNLRTKGSWNLGDSQHMCGGA